MTVQETVIELNAKYNLDIKLANELTEDCSKTELIKALREYEKALKSIELRIEFIEKILESNWQ